MFLTRLTLDIKVVSIENRKSLIVFFKYSERQSSSFVTCFYCMRKGHSAKNCNIKKVDIPKGLIRWVPKGIINNVGPKFNRGPILET